MRAPASLRPLFLSGILVAAVVGCGGDDSGTEAGGSSSTTATTAGTTTTTGKAVDFAALGESPVIKYLQETLDTLGFFPGTIDGVYGPQTEAGLAAFQRSVGLPVTSQLDAATVAALAKASPAAQKYAVRALQTELVELGLYKDTIDGVMGPETVDAIEALQSEAGLPQTGTLDGATFGALQQRYFDEVTKGSSTGPGSSTTTTAPSNDPNILKPGMDGAAVQALQQSLTTLGYRTGGVDGSYGAATASAVMAFQKHEGLSRDGIAGPDVMSHLSAPTGAGPKSSAVGPRVEVDLDRQIAFVIDGSGTVTTINVSTGSGDDYTDADGTADVAYTPTGDFTVYEKDPGNVVAPLGTLYSPLYFKAGWAMHGSPSVPGYPASHGCVRVSDEDQDFVYPLMPVGAAISIYGTSLGDPSRGAPGF